MWRERFGKQALVGLCLAGLAVVIFTAVAQSQNPPAAVYDVTTQKYLDQLDSLLQYGTSTEKADPLLTLILDGAGPIPPLAEIIYKLAQIETDGEKLFQRYRMIIDLYPASAYAQKAVFEMVPLILMSDGQLGASCESLIWRRLESLLAAADDAVSIPEDPVLLQSDVMLSLIQLAHFRRDFPRVIDLAGRADSLTHQDQIQAALAYSLLQTGEQARALETINKWLDAFPESELKPFAILILFSCADTDAERQNAQGMMAESFYNTIEAIQMRGMGVH